MSDIEDCARECQTVQNMEKGIADLKAKITELEIKLGYAEKAVEWHESREWELGSKIGDLEAKITEANKILDEEKEFLTPPLKRLREFLAGEEKH